MSMTLRDGRELDAVAHGDSGPALVFHHGTPSVAESYEPWVRAALDRGFRWISVTRPGYGSSGRRAGRSVADNCAEVAEVLDALGVGRFVAMGWSGGGPHALACGALLAARCAGVVTLGGVAPWDSLDAADWLAGMGPENHAEFGAAVRGEAALREFLEPARAELVDIDGARVAESLGGLVDAPDRRALTGGFADAVAASFRAAVRPGVDGWLDDDLAFVRPWGFDLSDVRVPVAVWQGSDDRMVPYAHGELLADRLPDARAHLLAGEGHLSIVLDRFAEAVAEARALVGD